MITKKIIALLIILIPFFGFTQDSGLSQDGEYVEVQDFESWTSIALKFKAGKKWTFDLQEQMRLDNNSSEIKGFFTQIGTDVEIFKGFKTGLGLRFINRYDNEGSQQGWEHYFRYHLDVSYKHKIDRFTLKYRFRYQNLNEISLSRSEGDIPISYLRLKFQLGYNIKNWKLDPFVSGELFNHRENGINYGLSDYRITVGTNYKMKNFGKLGIYYRYEKEISDYYPKTSNVLRIKYTYTFKSK